MSKNVLKYAKSRFNDNILQFLVFYTRFHILYSDFPLHYAFCINMGEVEGCELQNILHMASESANLNSKEQKFLIFRLKCILYDISKLILFTAFFAVMHKLSGFIFAFLIFYPIRQISGGLHFKHYFSCLVFSFVYMLLVVAVLSPLTLELAVVVPILAVCATVIYAIGPIRPPSRPALSKQEFAEHRKKAFSIVCYEAVLVVLFFDSELASVGYWTIILHTLQLVIAFIVKKGGERNA